MKWNGRFRCYVTSLVELVDEVSMRVRAVYGVVSRGQRNEERTAIFHDKVAQACFQSVNRASGVQVTVLLSSKSQSGMAVRSLVW